MRKYNNIYEYHKDNIIYYDRYKRPYYKRRVIKCVTNRYNDVVKVYAK